MDKELISDVNGYLLERGITLSQRELSNLRDFAIDRDRVGVSVLGWIYTRFITFLTPKRGKTHSVAPQPKKDPFQQEKDRFSGLSNYYGGLYRGAFVLNYLMSAAAVFVALIPYGFSFEKYFGRDAYRHEGVFIALELLIITVIMLIYFVGATPYRDKHHKHSFRFMNRRWHERWIEYRTLSEQFRYANLLYLIGLNPLHEGAAQNAQLKDWTNAYLAYRLSQADPKPMESLTDYKDYLSSLMSDQILYHQNNTLRSRHIYKKLHTIGFVMFYGTLVTCAVHFIWHSPVLTLLSGALPAVGAAMHGILASGEFSKSADISEGMSTQIADQLSQLSFATDVQTVRAIAKQFHDTVINEVLGWKVMFEDKNVPLA